MRRRTVLQTATALSSSLLWAPAGFASQAQRQEKEEAHNLYFSKLNALLRDQGPGRPVMLIDRQALEHNVKAISASVGKNKTWRIVVKSLPSVPLLRLSLIHISEPTRPY